MTYGEAASLGEGSGTAGSSQDEGSDGGDLNHFERLKKKLICS